MKKAQRRTFLQRLFALTSFALAFPAKSQTKPSASPGSGTTARKMINVKDPAYGATGDGKTDDTAAIRKACAAASPGSTIMFPSGTYKIDPTTNGVAGTAWNFSPKGGDLYAGAVVTADDVMLQGDGATILGSATTPSKSDRCNAMFVVMGKKGAPVSRFTMQGMTFNLQNQSGSVALYMQWVRDVRISGNTVRNHASMIDALSFDNTLNAVSTGNTFRDGGIAHGLYAAINTTISDNTASNIRELLDADKAETAKGNTQIGSKVIVTGNTYTRTAQDTVGDAAIEINGYADVTIEKNTIKNSNDGIRITSKPRNGTDYPASRISIRNNTIESVARSGIILGDNGTNDFVNHLDILIQGNTIDGAKTNGLKLRGKRIEARGNTIRNSGAAGIYAENVGRSQNLDDFTISDNVVTGSGGHDIELDRSSNGVVSGNKVDSNAGQKGGVSLVKPAKIKAVGI